MVLQLYEADREGIYRSEVLPGFGLICLIEAMNAYGLHPGLGLLCPVSHNGIASKNMMKSCVNVD